MYLRKPTTLATALLLTAAPIFAANIFAPGDPILGGRSDGTNFIVGAIGGDGGNAVYTDNFWPTNETPDHIIDGVGQKYLNFAELNTGVIITPNFNGGLGSIVTGINLWTANDSPDRDPTSYALYGSNSFVSGAGPFPLSGFSLISTGSLTPPGFRNPGGAAALDAQALYGATFANSTGYKTYMLLFPTVLNETTANSMQVAEVQLTGNAIPEPASVLLLGVTALGLAARRRRA